MSFFISIPTIKWLLSYLMIMVSTLVGLASLGIENLTSLENKDIFITNTTKLARLFFEIQHKQKVTTTWPSDSKFNLI